MNRGQTLIFALILGKTSFCACTMPNAVILNLSSAAFATTPILHQLTQPRTHDFAAFAKPRLQLLLRHVLACHQTKLVPKMLRRQPNRQRLVIRQLALRRQQVCAVIGKSHHTVQGLCELLQGQRLSQSLRAISKLGINSLKNWLRAAKPPAAQLKTPAQPRHT